jgi:hypothetical protein
MDPAKAALAVNRVTERSDCTDALFAQQRNPALPFVATIIAIAGMISTAAAGLNSLLFGPLSVVIGTCIFGAGTTYVVIGRTRDRIVIIRSSKWRYEPRNVVKEYKMPVPVAVDRGAFGFRVNIAGDVFYVSSRFESMLKRILS